MDTSAPVAEVELRATAPDWFSWAISRPKQSRRVVVQDCPIHYLFWPVEPATSIGRGLLLVHGGGAHANWWTFIAPYFTRYFRVAHTLVNRRSLARRTTLTFIPNWNLPCLKT